jgi:hypothetical protein
MKKPFRKWEGFLFFNKKQDANAGESKTPSNFSALFKKFVVTFKR